jgi:hypothetical protein
MSNFLGPKFEIEKFSPRILEESSKIYFDQNSNSEEDKNLISDSELNDMLVENVLKMIPSEQEDTGKDYFDFHVNSIMNLETNNEQDSDNLIQTLTERLNRANNTKECIISALHELPPNNPFRKSLISVIAPSYRSQRELAKDIRFSHSLVSRAVNMNESECLLRTTKNTPNTKRPHKATTDNLKLAHDIIQDLIPLNSAHVRSLQIASTNYTPTILTGYRLKL